MAKELTMKIILVTAILVGAAAFQLRKGDVSVDDRAQLGTINGQPLLGEKPSRALNTFIAKHGNAPVTDADKQEVASITAKNNCDAVKESIMEAARGSEKAKLGVYVSPDEVAEATKQYWETHDPSQDMEHQRAHWIANSQAVAAVLDQHQDSEKVYQTMLAPIGENHQAWQINLTRWRRPEARTALDNMAAKATRWNLDAWKKGMDDASRAALERRKVDDAVDDQLATQDQQFRADLATQRKGASGNIWRWSGGPQTEYLLQTRQQYWQARYAEQHVTLSDPNLAPCKP
jgi:hypothetical protein